MYSKADAQLIKKEFWSTFGNEYPRKWLLYNTKIKDVTFKFNVDNKKAYVMLDIEPKDENKRKIYFEKVESLKEILIEEFLSDVIFDREHYLESGKIISRVWVELSDVSLNRNQIGKPFLISFMIKWMLLSVSSMKMKIILKIWK
jgi:hypothetical protein